MVMVMAGLACSKMAEVDHWRGLKVKLEVGSLSEHLKSQGGRGFPGRVTIR